MGTMAITMHVDSSDVVVDDPEVVRFLLSQPDPGAALRSSLRLGVESLRLSSEPWPDRDSGGFRISGANA